MPRFSFVIVVALLMVCLLNEGVSVSDEEFKKLAAVVDQLKNDLKEMSEKCCGCCVETQSTTRAFDQEITHNVTVEERVTLLEIQVADLDEDVNFLFDGQIIQDERLFELEQDMDQTVEELNLFEDQIEDLEDTTLALDFRVTILEENGGGDGGNSSVSELEERVETLEETGAEHETDIADLESISSTHETKLTAAEENIEGLLTTDVLFDARITALEKGGGGSNQNGSVIAFHVALTSYDSIDEQTTVIFDEVFLNEGDGYNSSSGVFTVPPFGDGFYYISFELQTDNDEGHWFELTLNGDNNICFSLGDDRPGQGGYPHISCSAALYLVEGDEVEVFYNQGSDTTPLLQSSFKWNVFSGFRI